MTAATEAFTHIRRAMEEMGAAWTLLYASKDFSDVANQIGTAQNELGDAESEMRRIQKEIAEREGGVVEYGRHGADGAEFLAALRMLAPIEIRAIRHAPSYEHFPVTRLLPLIPKDETAWAYSVITRLYVVPQHHADRVCEIPEFMRRLRRITPGDLWIRRYIILIGAAYEGDAERVYRELAGITRMTFMLGVGLDYETLLNDLRALSTHGTDVMFRWSTRFWTDEECDE